nr:MAG TPA: hypothetical protein [Caudoviricetes sp.]
MVYLSDGCRSAKITRTLRVYATDTPKVYVLKQFPVI